MLRVPPKRLFLRSRRAVLPAVSALVLLWGGGCFKAPAGQPASAIVAARAGGLDAAGFSFAEGWRLVPSVFVERELREALLAPVAPFRWRGTVPRASHLFLGLQVLPKLQPRVQELEVSVRATVDGDTTGRLLGTARATKGSTAWLDLDVDLSGLAGEQVTLRVEPRVAGLAAHEATSDVLAWSPVEVTAPAAPATKRPNVLVILVDTTRSDHLTPYGYRRDTTPNLESRLARPGAVVERAYSQAPWTMPSVASLFTGHYPGWVYVRTGNYRVPEGAATLAQVFRDNGYETAAFIGNPILNAFNGYGRGFSTFYAPDGLRSMELHAESVNARALPWLRAHRGRPFFLYVHYIDPHDPYDNAEIIDGRSPFYPSYQGDLKGESVNAIFGGARPVPTRQEDRRQLAALYDSELHYVDGAIGQLLSGMPDEVLKHTVVVMTADHGEELLDHGGVKHALTLYEEQIHIPMVLRWDGHIPPGTRLHGIVQLLDLPRTLVDAAGIEPPVEWQGKSLLPALEGHAAWPREIAYSERVGDQPFRAAVILDSRKLVLFNRNGDFDPKDDLGRHLWEDVSRRLRRIEAYDLEHDAGEQRPLDDSTTAATVAALQLLIHRHLDQELPGFRVVACGLPPGSRLHAEVHLEGKGLSLVPYLLSSGDHASLASDGDLVVDLTAEALDKGVRIEGDLTSIGSPRATVEGTPPGVELSCGDGAACAGPSLPVERLRGAPLVRCDSGPKLYLWQPLQVLPTAAPDEQDPETLRALKALGYIG